MDLLLCSIIFVAFMKFKDCLGLSLSYLWHDKAAPKSRQNVVTRLKVGILTRTSSVQKKSDGEMKKKWTHFLMRNWHILFIRNSSRNKKKNPKKAVSKNRLTVWFAPSGSLLNEWMGAAWNGFNSQLARQLCPNRLCQWISPIILTFLLLTTVSVWLLKSPYSVKPCCHMAVKRQVTWLHSQGQPTPIPDSPSCLSPPEPPSCHSDISRFKRLPWPFQNNQFSIPDPLITEDYIHALNPYWWGY